MVPFSKPSLSKLEKSCLIDALNGSLSGDGSYTFQVYKQFQQLLGIKNMLLTTSGTSALEMAALLLDLKPEDEVIVPSYTFSSTVNAFMLRGAVPVFCDIRTDTMNLDESLLESLITPKTRAIFTVDYAGVPCEMDTINEIAQKHSLHVVEDAAQAVGSYYKGKPAGTLSELGCFSFHSTKNYSMGEGGALIINQVDYLKRSEIIREKGTNRREALMGIADKYTWHDIGSSYLPSDLLAAVLCAQLQRFDEIMEKRMSIWNIYHEKLESLENAGKLIRPIIPKHVTHNAHMYYILLPEMKTRDRLIDFLKQAGISAYFHYIPLHSAPVGQKLGYTAEMLPKTEEYSTRLLRLPLYTDMPLNYVYTVVQKIQTNLE